MLESKASIPRYSSGSIVIGLDDGYAGRVFYEINFNVVNIQRHFDLVVIRRESQTRDLANEDLFTSTFALWTVGFEEAVCRKDTFSKQRVKS